MPTFVPKGEEEGEGVAPAGGELKGDLARATSNITLAEHAGKFVAGELAHRYNNENLAGKLANPGAVAVTVTWG